MAVGQFAKLSGASDLTCATGQAKTFLDDYKLETCQKTSMDELFSLGVKLRELRRERHLSQRDLASQAGISPNAISLIERDEISPSVATLQRLAAALNVKMSYFFEDDSAQTSVIHIKANERPSLTSKGLMIAGLGRRLRGQELEPFFVVMAPEAESGRQPVIHSGHEFACCLSGTVEYEIDGTLYRLQAGDFLLFEAELPHHWRNPCQEKAELLLVLQTSNGSDEAVRRHFSSHPSVTHFG